MLTEAGVAWICSALVSGESLAGARVVVGDGDRPFDPADSALAGEQTASAAQAADPVVEGGTVTLTAAFDEREAVFDWLECGILVGDVLIDRTVADHGRKALGSVWTLSVSLDLTPEVENET